MKTTKPLDLTKPLQLTDGTPVQFLGRVRGVNPLVFAVPTIAGDDTYVIRRQEDGTELSTGFLAVVNSPPPKFVGYISMYRDNSLSGPFFSRSEADHHAGASIHNRVACIRVEWTEGQFDE